MTNNKNNNKKVEFSDSQSQRIDEIHNAVFEMCKTMAENPKLNWNMSFIEEIADYAAFILTQHDIRVRFPSITVEKDGSQRVEEYWDEN